jgi:hypothetical protein
LFGREKRLGNNLYQELSFQDTDALGDVDEGADLTGKILKYLLCHLTSVERFRGGFGVSIFNKFILGTVFRIRNSLVWMHIRGPYH